MAASHVFLPFLVFGAYTEHGREGTMSLYGMLMDAEIIRDRCRENDIKVTDAFNKRIKRIKDAINGDLILTSDEIEQMDNQIHLFELKHFPRK